MFQTRMLDWVIILSTILSHSHFLCMPTPIPTFHSTWTPSISPTTLYSILPIRSNRILHFRPVHLQLTIMVRSRHIRIPQWVRPSLPQSTTRRQGPLIPPQHLHRNRSMITSIYISIVRTPTCDTSDLCRIIPVIGRPTCPPLCDLITYTTQLAKTYSTQSQMLLLYQLQTLRLLLSLCNMSILRKFFTLSIPIHSRIV